MEFIGYVLLDKEGGGKGVCLCVCQDISCVDVGIPNSHLQTMLPFHMEYLIMDFSNTKNKKKTLCYWVCPNVNGLSIVFLD